MVEISSKTISVMDSTDVPASVAVVIPLYNKKPYIARALHSVLNQTYRPQEIIVVDDGSIDGGDHVVERFLDEGIRLMRQPNSGVSVARNRGTLEATSDWIAFLDADDEWHEDFLAYSVKGAMDWNQAVAVFTNYDRGNAANPVLEVSSKSSVLVEDYFRFVLRNRGHGMTSSSVLVRRDILLKIGGFPEGVGREEDIDTWTRLAWAGPIVYVPRVLAHYYDILGSVSKSPHLIPPNDPWERKIWPPDGAISDSLRRSSRAFFQLRRRWHVGRLLTYGYKGGALWYLLRECSPFPDPIGYLKLVLRVFLPNQAMSWIRRVFGK